MTRRGFTLVEVTLAMGIMAVGTLGLISLYSFGYRENQQSVEDVRAAALAQYYLNAMTAALSSENMKWSDWVDIGTCPANGWGAYACDGSKLEPEENATRSTDRLTKSKANSFAKQAFDAVMSASPAVKASFDVSGASDMCIGIVVVPSDDCRRYSVSVRCSARAGSLVYQPLYYTEVAFQGLKEAGFTQ